ncbi:phospholipase A1-like [Battus philenor]|uniref:phospholipase A1-like n=1 Tax=Battus philenor TaxID=42288 RepID=UPI0035CF7519
MFIFYLMFIAVFVNVKCDWGPFQALLYSDLIDCDHNKEVELDVGDTVIYFYDFKNNFNMSYKIEEFVDGLSHYYNLDSKRKLIFFVPGYKSNINKNTEEIIRQTFWNVPDIYLIIVDHSAYTSSKGGARSGYERAVTYTYHLGNALGDLLVDIHNKGFPSDRIHCIGHSLGAQMLGYAGTAYKSVTSEMIWRITGIDPAGPCFSNSVIEDQIRSGVSRYVEVYHCNVGELGTTSVLADTDFFINNGKKQPECHEGLIPGYGASEAAKCSHKACVKYWAQTVHHPGWYTAWKCDSYKKFSKGKCAKNLTCIAGYTNPGNATGVFYASTEIYGVI